LIRPDRVPFVEEMVDADLTVVMGPLQNADAGLELAGRIRLALEQGASVVFCYHARLNQVDEVNVPAMAPGAVPSQLRGTVHAVTLDPPPDPAFRTYLLEFGQTDQGFTSLGPATQVLASAHYPTANTMIAAAFVSTAIGSGRFYVLPMHTAGGVEGPLHRLVDAVIEHQGETSIDVPAFLGELTLPGEADLAAEIEATTAKLEELDAGQRALVRHKLLMSHADGAPFEELVVEELNAVLEGASLQAEDTLERFVEDFALMEDSEMRAIGEAKAARRNVTHNHVDQLHRHRAEVLTLEDEVEQEDPGPAPIEVPGLLVVNTFRNDDDLARRQTEPVHERVFRYARRMNVLVLRSSDLFAFVVRRLEGNDDSARLAELILTSGGGWLEVRDDVRLHPPA
jgi:hypothetical protein